jgi:hypothetical protein
MPDKFGLAVEGAAQLTKVFNHAPADVKKAYRNELRTVALPVAETYTRLASSRIRRMQFSPQWAKTRIGVTQRLVYVVPRQKGTKGRGSRRRRNLFRLMAERAAEPALELNRARIRRDFELMLDRLANKWEAEGPHGH